MRDSRTEERERWKTVSRQRETEKTKLKTKDKPRQSEAEKNGRKKVETKRRQNMMKGHRNNSMKGHRKNLRGPGMVQSGERGDWKWSNQGDREIEESARPRGHPLLPPRQLVP